MDESADLLRREVLNYFQTRQRYENSYERLFCELLIRRDDGRMTGAHVTRERDGNGYNNPRDSIAENTFVLILRGESVREISRLCRCDRNTVRRRYRRGKALILQRFPWVQDILKKNAVRNFRETEEGRRMFP